MATACIAQVSFEFQGIRQPIVARFDQPHASSDGGALLLKAVDDRLGVTERLARSLRDPRQPGKIDHPLIELVRQRVYGMACGYADCNDAARLAEDPMHKLLLERDPLAGPDLGSQPTLSRFENAVGRPLSIWRASGWPISSSSTIGSGSGAASAGSRSTSIRPTIPPTGSRSSASSTGTTTPGAICRSSRR